MTSHICAVRTVSFQRLALNLSKPFQRETLNLGGQCSPSRLRANLQTWKCFEKDLKPPVDISLCLFSVRRAQYGSI
jgi:hypothetical protein